jgi:hypothetical protein
LQHFNRSGEPVSLSYQQRNDVFGWHKPNRNIRVLGGWGEQTGDGGQARRQVIEFILVVVAEASGGRTHLRHKVPHAGFEDQAQHRPRIASKEILAGL